LNMKTEKGSEVYKMVFLTYTDKSSMSSICLGGHYVIINDLCADEWTLHDQLHPEYLGNVVETLNDKYTIRVIGEVEEINGTYYAADYEKNTTIKRDIKKVVEVPVEAHIICE